VQKLCYKQADFQTGANTQLQRKNVVHVEIGIRLVREKGEKFTTGSGYK